MTLGSNLTIPWHLKTAVRPARATVREVRRLCTAVPVYLLIAYVLSVHWPLPWLRAGARRARASDVENGGKR